MTGAGQVTPAWPVAAVPAKARSAAKSSVDASSCSSEAGRFAMSETRLVEVFERRGDRRELGKR